MRGCGACSQIGQFPVFSVKMGQKWPYLGRFGPLWVCRQGVWCGGRPIVPQKWSLFDLCPLLGQLVVCACRPGCQTGQFRVNSVKKGPKRAVLGRCTVGGTGRRAETSAEILRFCFEGTSGPRDVRGCGPACLGGQICENSAKTGQNGPKWAFFGPVRYVSGAVGAQNPHRSFFID